MQENFKYPNLQGFERNRDFLPDLIERKKIFKEIIDKKRPGKLIPELEHQIFDGSQELVDLFNKIDINDSVLSLPSLSRTKALKEKIGQLPNLEDLNNPVEFIVAMLDGSKSMLKGQENKEKKQKGLDITQEEIDSAIGTPSLNIPPKTKAIGSSLHLIERQMFAHFRNKDNNLKGGDNWKKDEILFALEDMAQLRHVQRDLNQTKKPETILFNLINSQNTEGGLGWRKPENLETIKNELKNISIK